MLFPRDSFWLQDPRFDGLMPIETLGRYQEREAVFVGRVLANGRWKCGKQHRKRRRVSAHKG